MKFLEGNVVVCYSDRQCWVLVQTIAGFTFWLSGNGRVYWSRGEHLENGYAFL